MPEFLINSLSDHYNSPGRRAEYKHQFQRVARQPGDDPSVFAMELETLARRVFMDVDLKIQLQMVRDHFIDGQADRSLRRHLDSLEPNTPMIEMVDSCRIWERHCEPEIRPRMGTNKGPVHMTGQVSEDRPIPAIPSEIESVEEMIGPEIYRQRHSCTATDGNDLPTNAGGTGTTSNERLGNAVIKSAPSGNSHGGGLHRGVLFMRRMDT